MSRSSRTFLLGGAVGMIAAVAVIFGAKASTEGIRSFGSTKAGAAPPALQQPAPEPDEVVARTGDGFWGLHVEGVIPCSSMLVRGGGHLVILTRDDRPIEKCSYHVKGKKTVSLDARRFVLSVVGDDQIRAERVTNEPSVADAPEPTAVETAAEAEPEQIAAQP